MISEIFISIQSMSISSLGNKMKFCVDILIPQNFIEKNLLAYIIKNKTLYLEDAELIHGILPEYITPEIIRINAEGEHFQEIIASNFMEYLIIDKTKIYGFLLKLKNIGAQHEF